MRLISLRVAGVVIACATLGMTAVCTVIDPSRASVPQMPSGTMEVDADFNCDGFADMAVGSPGEDVGTVSDAGATRWLPAVTWRAVRVAARDPTRAVVETEVAGLVVASIELSLPSPSRVTTTSPPITGTPDTVWSKRTTEPPETDRRCPARVSWLSGSLTPSAAP